jgi:murein DD-endopeptidase MepM/ murein hydrolase activator NlpD
VQRETDPPQAAAEPRPSPADGVIGAAPPPDPARDDLADPPTIAAAPAAVMEALPTQRFRLPIDGITTESFKDSYFERRGDRAHEAIDINVPRGTPIYAVRDGTIAKLFYSDRGGITIYHFEEDGPLCFYYAHLERYADGLKEGQHVSQGEVIGFVGTSGNASPDAPHLHFAITELNADRKWWQGRALDPYVVFKGQGQD